MNGLSLNYGDAWGLGSSSRNEQIAQELTLVYKERVAKEVTLSADIRCDRQTFEDIWAETGRKSELPTSLRVIKRNNFYRNRVLESMKKELGEEAFNTKSFTVAMFEEKDIEACKKIGVTPEQMVEFLKSLY